MLARCYLHLFSNLFVYPSAANFCRSVTSVVAYVLCSDFSVCDTAFFTLGRRDDVVWATNTTNTMQGGRNVFVLMQLVQLGKALT